MWNDAVITNAGKELLAEWVNSKTLSIDAAATGEGTAPASQLMGQTALVNQKQTMSIIGVEKIANGIRLQLQLTSKGVASSYTINQIGIWASLTGGTQKLIALYQDATGVRVPTETEMSDYVFTFYATLQMNNSGNLTVNIDTSASVTIETLNKATIVKADKVLGATAGNLAALDENGNLTDSGESPASFDAAGAASAVGTALDKQKANKVDTATDGNLAGLTADGDLIDSGKSPDDFDVAGAAGDVQKNLDSHESNKENPHGVTPAQLGFDLVFQLDSEGYPCYKITK